MESTIDSTTIMVINKSDQEIFVRISGEGDSFVLVDPEQSGNWSRQDECIMELTYGADELGPCFIVKPGTGYIVDTYFNVTDQDGEWVDYSAEGFPESEEQQNQQDDQNQGQGSVVDENFADQPQDDQNQGQGSVVDENFGDQPQNDQNTDITPQIEQPKIEDKNKNNQATGTTTEYFNSKAPVLTSGAFTDPDFPPNESSLISEDKEAHFTHGTDKLDISNIGWNRISKIFSGPYQIFKDKIEYNDIHQGSLGDCYLMSTIAALAKKPQLIMDLFKTKSPNPKGLYEIFYYENGKKKIMFVDDFIPVNNEDGQPYFAKPNGEEIWVMLLEKAFAKFEGGYSNINGGFSCDAFAFFTGCVTKNVKPLEERCWNQLLGAVNKHHIICSGTFPGSDSESSANGIFFGHEYSLCDAKEYNAEGEKLRLLQIRNPWGNGEWKGPYCDGDSRWTPQTKEFFKYQESCEEEGRFWMPLEDYINEFEDVTICYCGEKK